MGLEQHCYRDVAIGSRVLFSLVRSQQACRSESLYVRDVLIILRVVGLNLGISTKPDVQMTWVPCTQIVACTAFGIPETDDLIA